MQGAFHELHICSNKDQDPSQLHFSKDTAINQVPLSGLETLDSQPPSSSRIASAADDGEILKLLSLVAKQSTQDKPRLKDTAQQSRLGVSNDQTNLALPPPMRYPRRLSPKSPEK